MGVQEIFHQILLTIVFYVSVVALFRISGKRLAGQTTTFDLLILISLVVGLQQITMDDNRLSKVVFVLTAFALHLLLTFLCIRYQRFRYLVRGRPTLLVSEGELRYHALREEGLTLDELKAGLRKLGIDDVSHVKAAYLEETGQVSAIRGENEKS